MNPYGVEWGGNKKEYRYTLWRSWGASDIARWSGLPWQTCTENAEEMCTLPM